MNLDEIYDNRRSDPFAELDAKRRVQPPKDDEEEDDFDTSDIFAREDEPPSSQASVRRDAEDSEEDSDESSSSSSGEETDREDEDEKEDRFVPFQGSIEPYLEMIRVDPAKVTSESTEKRSRGKREISDVCVSKYKLGREVARGTQAVIYEGCEADSSKPAEGCPYIVRLALLRDLGKSAPKYQKNSESFARFERDVDVRRYLDDCGHQEGPFLTLVDAFICNREFGISVAPRLSGNLMQLLHRSNNPVGLMADIELKLRAAIQAMHSCGVAHRDISYQNLLYSGSEQKFELVITDFENAFIRGVTPIQSFENPQRIFDAYSESDRISLDTTLQELREIAALFSAVQSKNLDAAKRSWNSIGSFVKSDVKYSYPAIFEFLTKGQ